eukprot:TRINITY_DN45518_c0_g1_i1.p1 TRINITY_DN45518_c0_g1~~TRINITY_DN45518_c0_g1_i1.p1  ORF type:complete len:1116 (+),score=369.48 TRINITY_DN45518_c0_g1_i1:79-3426(+)
MAAPADIAELLRALLGNDNATRNAAEKKLEEAKKADPAKTVESLFGVLAARQLETAALEQAAVLLRQCLSKLKDENSIWVKLGPNTQEQCKALVLQLFESEPTPQVRKKVADILQALGNQLTDLDEDERPQNVQAWPEMLPKLMAIITDGSRNAGTRADALWAMQEMQVSIWQVMVANAGQTGQVIRASLGDGQIEVRASAGALLCRLAENLDKKEDRQLFAPLLEPLCQVLQQLASGADNKHLNMLLEVMQDTAEANDFFKDALNTALLPVLSTVAKSHGSEDTQRFALQVLTSMGQSRPKAMVKNTAYLQATFEVCLHFLMHLDDDAEAWAQGDEENDEEDENFNMGKEKLDSLGRSMSSAERFPACMEVLKPMIAGLFASGGWKQVVAGVTALSQIAEFVDEQETVQQMMTGVLAQLKASHPRVRDAAWKAVAQFCEDHAEVVTAEEIASVLLPDFMNGLKDPCPRVLESSMTCFQYFGEAVERELLEPFVPQMMEQLGVHLQSGKNSLQKKAITFVAVVAGQVEDAFAPYYAPLMPLLKRIVETTLHKVEERQLLGKCFECISLLAKAVGPAAFRADAEGIMMAMISATQVPDLPSNDPVKEYTLAASERICGTLKNDFLPFVPAILPGILEKFTLSPQEYNPSSQKFDQDTEVSLTLIQEGGNVKVLIMSTSEMEDLKNALSCVHTFAEELGKLYAPFVAQTAQALLPVFEFAMDEEIRDLAFETWGQLCNSARTGDQNQVLGELVKEFLGRILPKLQDTQDLDVAALKTRADGIVVCLRKAGPGILGTEQLRQICDVALQTVSESLKRREDSANSQKTPAVADGEEEEKDDDEDASEEEMALRVACCEIAGALAQHHPDAFAAELLPKILTVIQQLLRQGAPTEDKQLAFYLACDMLEHLQQRTTPHWQQFMGQLLQGIADPTPALRQPACFGVSLASKDPAFASFAGETANKLSEVVAHARTLAKKKSEKPAQAAADNALSALAAVLTHHAAAVANDESRLWGVWMQGLPCQVDQAEGVKNHKMLLQAVQQQNAKVLGEGGAKLAHALGIFIDVYKTDMADEETSAGIGSVVLQLGEARLEQLAAQLKDRQKKKLLRIHREAQAAQQK